MMEKNWSHEELQHDLADTRKAVGEIVAERLSIGSFGSGGQMDVFAMKPSWANPNPVVYEVKVTRQDFRGDTQTGKYRRYLPYCRRLYFAAPQGLLKKEDLPEGMGLCVRGENGWHTIKAPRIQGEPDGFHEILFSLLLKIHPDGFTPPTRIERVRKMLEAEDLRKAKFDLPPRFREILNGAQGTKDALRHARHDVARELGVDPDEDPRDLGRLVKEVLARAPTAKPKGLGAMRMNLVGIRNYVDSVERVIDAIEDAAA